MLNLRKRSIYAKHRALFILAGIVVEVVILGTLVVLAIVVFGSAYFRVVEHPKFCGSLCHNMEASYKSYKKSAHDGIRCARCHSRTGFVDGFLKDTIYATAKEVFIYMEGEAFYDMEEVHPKVSNESCLRRECHKVKLLVEPKGLFIDDRAFKHSLHLPTSLSKAHDGSLTAAKMSGMPLALNCSSCHSRNEESHMAIDQRVCFLCHFGSGKKVAATQDCASCHAVPAAQHEAVMGDSSSCIKCHRTAEAEIKVQLGKCAQCHEDRSNYADMAHDKHVSSQHARCMDCHELMKHKHGELSAHYDEDCQKCHSTQESMFQGRTAFMAKAMPSTMAEMVDCSSCHIPVADEGVSSLSGIKESCAICHEEGYEEMADNWQEMIRDDGIEPAEKLLSSVQKLLKESADKPQYAKASSIYEEARARLLFVKKDGSLGVHNVDLADTLLTDAIDKLKECQGMLK